MYLNKTKVFQLMNEKCDGNYNAFARELGVNVAHLHRFLNIEGSEAGPKLLGAVAKYCEKHGLDYREYIFLDKPLTICNGDVQHKKQKPNTA